LVAFLDCSFTARLCIPSGHSIEMKPIFCFPALLVLTLLAGHDQATGQTPAAKPLARLSFSPHQVERAAIASRNTNRLLGSLLRVTTRRIEGRYFFQQGTWWYWMPQGYWVVWDGERWVPYQQ
jgi:hypothetical protein